MLLPTIAITKDEVLTEMRSIWAAMGEGPSAFARPLCTIDPLATWETLPTHHMLLDMGCTDSKAAIWQAMAENNDLPPIEGVWGDEENGIITAPEAQAAISGHKLLVFTGAGIDDGPIRNAFVAGVLLGMGLQYVPDSL